MIRDNLERAVEGSAGDEEARGNMLVAANLAITIALGAVHAMSHPAGAHFGVPHGVANAIHLPHVIRHNAAGGPRSPTATATSASCSASTTPTSARRCPPT